MHLKTNVILLIVLIIGSLTSYAKPVNDMVLVGKSHMSRGDIELAVFFLSRAIEENPDQVEPYLHRAKGYILMDKYQAAMDDYKIAMALDSVFVKAFMKKKSISINNEVIP